MSRIRLAPTGHLFWETSDDRPAPARVTMLQEQFLADWREGLFTLAAEKIEMGDSLTLRFWHGIRLLLLGHGSWRVGPPGRIPAMIDGRGPGSQDRRVG